MIPLAVVLIPFAIFLVIYLFFLYFNCYHIRIYGVHGFWSHALVTLFLLGTIAILGGSLVVLSRYDWNATIDLQHLAAPFANTDVLTSPL